VGVWGRSEGGAELNKSAGSAHTREGAVQHSTAQHSTARSGPSCAAASPQPPRPLTLHTHTHTHTRAHTHTHTHTHQTLDNPNVQDLRAHMADVFADLGIDPLMFFASVLGGGLGRGRMGGMRGVPVGVSFGGGGARQRRAVSACVLLCKLPSPDLLACPGRPCPWAPTVHTHTHTHTQTHAHATATHTHTHTHAAATRTPATAHSRRCHRRWQHVFHGRHARRPRGRRRLLLQ
jgi:hypothetical protein